MFTDILGVRAHTMQYTINKTPYKIGYYLAYVYMLEWAKFVKATSISQGEKRNLFAQRQE